MAHSDLSKKLNGQNARQNRIMIIFAIHVKLVKTDTQLFKSSHCLAI